VTRGNLLTQAEARKRGRPTKEESRPHGLVTLEVFAQAKKDKEINKRLCGKLTESIRHEESIKYLDNKVHKRGKVCYWCGDPTWTYCGVCKDPITKEPLTCFIIALGRARGRGNAVLPMPTLKKDLVSPEKIKS
jgi:hypothetical protein